MRRFIFAALVAAMVLTLSVPALALDGDTEPVVVSDAEALIEAIARAEDGDTIYIDSEIQPENGDVIGSLDSQIILKRADEFTGQFFKVYYPCTIQNIDFDCANGGNALYISSIGVNISDCKFQGFSSGYIVSMYFGCQVSIENCTFDITNSEFSGVIIDTLPDTQVDIINSVFTNTALANNARAIFNAATMNCFGCTFNGLNSGNGGGAIYNTPAADLKLEGCTLTRNSGTYGGAVQNNGTLTIVNSRIYGNTAIIQGNDIFNSSDTAQLTIQNSIEEYSELFSDFDYPTMGWYYDSATARYDDNNAVPLPILRYQTDDWNR